MRSRVKTNLLHNIKKIQILESLQPGHIDERTYRQVCISKSPSYVLWQGIRDVFIAHNRLSMKCLFDYYSDHKATNTDLASACLLRLLILSHL